MTMSLYVHIVAGSLSLLAGYSALYASKGARLHRRSGQLFVVTMLTMASFGALMALTRDKAAALNVPAALLTAYLVVTGLTTVRPPASGAYWLERGAMLLALSVGLICLLFGFEAVGSGGVRSGMPAFPYFMFAGVGLLAAIGDVRMLHAGGLHGQARLARHLWRMSFALLLAAMSFFLGQADVFPKPLRTSGLLALPVLAVLVTMIYWLWRVRRKHAVGAKANLPSAAIPESA